MRVVACHFASASDDTLDPDPEEPIGLEYVLSALARDGHKTSLIVTWPEGGDLFEQILQEQPDAVLLQVYTRDVAQAIWVSTRLKETLPGIWVIAGGCHPTALPHKLLTEAEGAIDFCVIREGEATIRELLDCPDLRDMHRLASVPGIAFPENGGTLSTVPRELIENLDSLPWPIREPRYYDLPTGGFYYPESSRLRYAPVVYSRGCPGQCEFCSSRQMWGRSPRFRDPRDVVREMNHVHSAYGVNFFFVEDLSINVDHLAELPKRKGGSHLESLCEAMGAGLHKEIHWACCANIGVTANQLQRMKEARCVSVSYGIETLNMDTLQRIQKRQSLSDIESTLRRSADVGMINYGFYMIGFDEDTEESIRRAAADLTNLPIHRLRVAFATPFPGSPWYERIDRRALSPDWAHFDTQHPVVLDHEIPPPRLQALREEVLHVFYGSEGYQRSIDRLLGSFPEYENSYEEFRAGLQKQGYA